MRVAAPPVDGKANEEARRYLAKLLGLPRSRLEVAHEFGEQGAPVPLLVVRWATGGLPVKYAYYSVIKPGRKQDTGVTGPRPDA